MPPVFLAVSIILSSFKKERTTFEIVLQKTLFNLLNYNSVQVTLKPHSSEAVFKKNKFSLFSSQLPPSVGETMWVLNHKSCMCQMIPFLLNIYIPGASDLDRVFPDLNTTNTVSWFKGTVLQEKGKGESFFFQEMDSENPLPPSLL